MKQKRRSFIRRRGIAFWLGLALSVGGAVVLGSIPFFYLRSAYVGHQLLKEAGNLVNNENSSESIASNVVGPVVNSSTSADNRSASEGNPLQLTSESLQVPGFKAGKLMGAVDIPALSLKAPLIQGTNASQLEVAVGHLVTSVMPGKPGTTLIAAHNATWFRHVDRLKPGNTIVVKTTYGTFTFTVTSSKVVKVGDPVPNTTQASIVLESCYPLNALYLTPYRFLVFGDLSKISNAHVVVKSPVPNAGYYAVVPDRIAREGLTLSSNTLPMGTLTYTGNPAEGFTQSNDAWTATHTMIELYLAWLHASSDKDQASLDAIAPKGAPDPFLGVPRNTIEYLSNYDITLHVEGERLLAATGTVLVKVNGVAYRVVLQGTAYGSQVKLTGIQISG